MLASLLYNTKPLRKTEENMQTEIGEEIMDEIQKKRLTYPRVSDILAIQNANALRSVPIDKLMNASLRGTAVDNYCTTFMQKLFMPEIEPQYQIYVDAFISWANKNIKKVVYTHRRLYDDVLCFSGEFDAIVILNNSNELTLIDIKATCLPSKTWSVQLAAYKHLCEKNGIKIDQIMNVHLKKSAKVSTQEIQGEKVKVSIPVVCAKEIRHEHSNSAWEIFSSALKCYDYFERKEAI